MQLSDGDAYWIEGRPVEQGRCVIVRERDGVVTDLVDAPYSARTWVHEYGGAAMLAHAWHRVFLQRRLTGASTPLYRGPAPSP